MQAFSATRTATAGHDERNKLNSKRALISNSLEAPTPRDKHFSPGDRDEPAIVNTPANGIDLHSKANLLSNDLPRAVNEGQASVGGEQTYMKVMDQEDQ